MQTNSWAKERKCICPECIGQMYERIDSLTDQEKEIAKLSYMTEFEYALYKQD